MYLLISADSYDNYSTNGNISEYNEDEFHHIMEHGQCSRGVYYTDLRREVLAGNYDIYQVMREVPHSEIIERYNKS